MSMIISSYVCDIAIHNHLADQYKDREYRKYDYPSDNVNDLSVVSCDFGRLNQFLAKLRIAHSFEEFDEDEFWAYFIIPKIKFKWSSTPDQTIIGSTIFSVFKKGFIVGVNRSNKILSTFQTQQPDIVLRIYEVERPPQNQTDLIYTVKVIIEHNDIFKNVDLSRIILPHCNVNYTEHVVDDDSQTISIKDKKKSLKEGFCLSKMTIDRHGVYINKQSKNQSVKIKYIPRTGDYIISMPYIFWIEDIKHHRILCSGFNDVN